MEQLSDVKSTFSQSTLALKGWMSDNDIHKEG